MTWIKRLILKPVTKVSLKAFLCICYLLQVKSNAKLEVNSNKEKYSNFICLIVGFEDSGPKMKVFNLFVCIGFNTHIESISVM